MLALCCGISKQQLSERTEALRSGLSNRGMTMAIGSVWKNPPDNIHAMISEAERLMYAEKSEYYRTMGIERRTC